MWGDLAERKKPSSGQKTEPSQRSLQRQPFGCILSSLASHLRVKVVQGDGAQADLAVNPGPATDTLMTLERPLL